MCGSAKGLTTKACNSNRIDSLEAERRDGEVNLAQLMPEAMQGDMGDENHTRDEHPRHTSSRGHIQCCRQRRIFGLLDSCMEMSRKENKNHHLQVHAETRLC